MKEEELQSIVQTMESLSSNAPAAAGQAKGRSKRTPTMKAADTNKSLKDKIAEQKQKLRRQPNPAKESAPRPKAPAVPKPQNSTLQSATKPVTRPQTSRTNYHKMQAAE